MSTLIDTLINKDHSLSEIDGCWVIPKPLNYYPIKERLKDAFRVLCNKSKAYHYYTDGTRSTL